MLYSLFINLKTIVMDVIEKELSAEDSLRLIQSMINQARNKVAESGFHLMVWGVLVIACCLINYILIRTGYGSWAGLPWLVMPFIGVPVGIIYERGRQVSNTVRTLADLHVNHMWLAYGVSLIIVLVYCSVMHVSPVPFIMLITGMVTFATGRVLQFKPLQLGGVVFWLGALLCIKVTNESQLLIHAATTFVGYIVPGILLWKQYKSRADV